MRSSGGTQASWASWCNRDWSSRENFTASDGRAKTMKKEPAAVLMSCASLNVCSTPHTTAWCSLMRFVTGTIDIEWEAALRKTFGPREGQVVEAEVVSNQPAKPAEIENGGKL